MFFLVEEELYFRFQFTEVRLKNRLQSYDFLKTWLSTFCLNLSIDLRILEKMMKGALLMMYIKKLGRRVMLNMMERRTMKLV